VGYTACNGACFNLLTDTHNCGNCGVVCSASSPLCASGTCTGTVAVIDGSNSCNSGLSFGLPADQWKRYETFAAGANATITSVDVKIRTMPGSTQTDVTVELYDLTTIPPGGGALATATIPSSLVTPSFTVVSAPLSYVGLVAGRRYGLVLGQVTPQSANYEWCESPTDPLQSFGKIQGGTWTDESSAGDGWYNVHTM
jgi:hypothetical protein